jgi:hypothetical protein
MQADSVSFHHARGEGKIRARKNGKQGWSDTDLDIAVPSRLVDHGKPKLADRVNFKAFECILYAKSTASWTTFLAIVKAGDHVAMEWVRDNNNQYIEETGCLHRDELRLVITRPTGRPRFRVLSILMDVSVCRDNSARMIQA